MLEAIPVTAPLFDADYTLMEYRAHLGRLLGLFEPLERAVADAASPGGPARDLQRSDDLVFDLRRMGSTAGKSTRWSGIDGPRRSSRLVCVR